MLHIIAKYKFIQGNKLEKSQTTPMMKVSLGIERERASEQWAHRKVIPLKRNAKPYLLKLSVKSGSEESV